MGIEQFCAPGFCSVTGIYWFLVAYTSKTVMSVPGSIHIVGGKYGEKLTIPARGIRQILEEKYYISAE